MKISEAELIKLLTHAIGYANANTLERAVATYCKSG